MLVLALFWPHILNFSNFNKYQSTYRPGCSTETALWLLLERIYSTTQASLDLNPAFDMAEKVSYSNGPSCNCSIAGNVHSWIHWYLIGRTHTSARTYLLLVCILLVSCKDLSWVHYLLCLCPARLQEGDIMFSTCMCMSMHSLICYQTSEHDILKTRTNFGANCCSGPWHKRMKHQLWGSEGQRSRSREAE